MNWARLLDLYCRWSGGPDLPFLLVEWDYLSRTVAPGSVVVDLGGGEGKLASRIASMAKWVIILDREETVLPGAD